MSSQEEEILRKGESIFLPNDENIDKKCYKINNIENWAETFYTLKSGIILERYKNIMSKSENSKFFEALNYEYGINNYPLDLNKAFEIYKKAADTSPDALSMYRLYRIYKKDFKKFNIMKRNFVLEKFYLLKCYCYLLPREKKEKRYSYMRFDIVTEISIQLIDEKKIVYKWLSEFISHTFKNNEIYKISKDDVLLIEAIIYKNFVKITGQLENIFNSYHLKYLEEKGNPEAIYNIANLIENKEKSFYLEKYEKLYKMNYYRSFSDYVKYLDYGKEALNIIKKSLLKGYYTHIKDYKDIFFVIHKFDDIFKVPELKSELMFIIGSMIDVIIADEIEILTEYFYLRKITIKHFNFGDIYKNSFDIYTKEMLNYLLKYTKGTNEENKDLMKRFFIINDFFAELYTRLGRIYYYGVSGIIERNLKEALDKLNFIEKTDNIIYGEAYHLYIIYQIKIKERKLAKIDKGKKGLDIEKNTNNNDDDELIKLEKKVINLNFDFFNLVNLKKFPPSIIYILSKLFGSSSINNEDLILEYALLNRAANAPVSRLEHFIIDTFEEQYLKYKAKKKIEEKNKKENFKKIKNAKGVINVEGYGDDGTICPICFQNEKSVICLPCKHFFCGACLDKVVSEETYCPICRGQIKITFDFNLKKENLIKSILTKSY